MRVPNAPSPEPQASAPAPVRPSSTGGIVLAGGKSTRMGRPKANLPFGNELMLQRVVRTLGAVTDPIVVVGTTGQALPELPPSILIAYDKIADRGPLQGLAAGFRTLENRCETAFACSCDVPLLKPSFVKRMIELLGEHDIAVPFVDDFHHPLAAVYHLKVVKEIESLLAADRRRPVFLFDSAHTRIVTQKELEPFDPQFDSLRNCNRPADYEQALVRAGLIEERRASSEADGADSRQVGA